LLLQSAQTLIGVGDGIDRLLKDDLLRGMFEGLLGKPAPVRQCPMTGTAVNPAMAQQEWQQLLALAAPIVGRRFAGPNQIAYDSCVASGTTSRSRVSGILCKGEL
jgi:hypothetical protein